MHKYTPLKASFICFVLLVTFVPAEAQDLADSTSAAADTLVRGFAAPVYRWRDSYLNRYTLRLPQSPFLNISPLKKSGVQLMPESQRMDVSQPLGSGLYYKLPQSLSFNEYSSLQYAAARRSILREFERLQDGNSSVSGRGIDPRIERNPIFDRIFGGKIPEFKPNGFISVDLRVGSEFIDNPMLPLFQRRQPIFKIDQQISLNFNNLLNSLGGGLGGMANGLPSRNALPEMDELDRFADPRNLKSALDKFGNVKDKLGVVGNFDTKSAFNFDNQFRINYRNEPENILQKLELGNISMPNRSQLIPGVQNLQGVKAGLRFGNLDVTTLIANQRSRTESIFVNGGQQARPFEIRSDHYDENRHFFLSHFFRNNYERWLRSLPMVISGVRITRVEVYVTNRSNAVERMRNVVGLAALGENVADSVGTAKSPVSNDKTTLFKQFDGLPSGRQIDRTNESLESLGLKKAEDFELLRSAKRLTDREFELNPELGYISLYSPLRNDEVLAVSYEYTYNGRAYRVGELAEDYASRTEEEVIALKLLKSSTIRNNLTNPMWDLMMKNVYAIGQGEVEREGFQLRVVYKDDRTGIDNPNLQEGKNLANVPLIQVMGLDRLNFNLDPNPDGNFDFIPNVTINRRAGVIVFPVLEPFGRHLARQFAPGEEELKRRYVFNELYRGTMGDAQLVTARNKFFLQGSVRLSGTDIPLPLGTMGSSVRVYAGGVELKQGADYMVDPQLGRIRITNQSILTSSRQIRIDYERPELFQSQIRRLFGLRLDYTIGRNLHIGGTFMDMREQTPGFLTRTAIGTEPVNNSQWGLDVNYRGESRMLTRLLDRLPIVETKEPSNVIFSAEFAQLLPGVNDRRINGGVRDSRVKGSVMIDDFEAARNIFDLTRQPTRWRLGSTPEEYRVQDTTKLAYNFRRAKMSVYTIDQSTFLTGGIGLTNNPDLQGNSIYEKPFVIQEIFPGRTRPVLGQQLPSAILDVAFFPSERGMYNFNPNLTPDGSLPTPRRNFGAVTRGITSDTDFDNVNSNVEYLEFWMLNPFADKVPDGKLNLTNTTGGKLLFHLGDVSEDVIPDSRFNFETGILPDSATLRPLYTKWGKAPRTQYVTDAFSTDPQTRARQDIGLDGLSNEEERRFYKTYLDAIGRRVTNADVLQKIQNDPSGDDYRFFLDPSFTGDNSLIQRFKYYLGSENNSPVTTQQQQFTFSNTFTADKEDLNNDNTINEVEAYYEYEVNLKPGMDIGNKYIVDKVKTTGNAEWYLFRIPIREGKKVGNINGFKSIRFMRMLMTDWEQPVVCRFATLQLVASQYRVYQNELDAPATVEVPPAYDAGFKIGTANIEENGCDDQGNCNVKPGRTPYVVPPGFRRDRDFSQFGAQMLFNEQSISLTTRELRDGDRRGVFKNTKFDLNMYKRLQMFMHAELPVERAFVQEPGVGAFIRIGTDLRQNYYEIEIPNLKITPNQEGLQDATVIWPLENEIDFPIDELRKLKIQRNQAGAPFDKRFTRTITIDGLGFDASPDVQTRTLAVNRTYNVTVVGNPDMSTILNVMLGVSNPKSADNESRAFTVWMNELRAYGFDQTPGEAGIMAADIKLADLGTLTLNGNFSTFGFGSVQDRITTRQRDLSRGFGVATNLDVDRFFPQNWGLSIPMFVSYDNQQIIPHFNPLDPDMPLDMTLDAITDLAKRDAFRNQVIDNSTKRGFNFTNVRKIRTNTDRKQRFYDIENFSFTYAQNNISRRNIFIDQYVSDQTRGGIGYVYQPKGFTWEPFKKKEFKEGRYRWVNEFNLSPIPTTISVRTDFDRNFIKTQYRNAAPTSPSNFPPILTSEGTVPNIQKYFLGNRYYDLQWTLTKSLNVNYKAVMNAIMDDVNTITPSFDNLDVIKGITRLGRPKNYTHGFDATWRLPFENMFLLDWIQADASYINKFGYRANSFGIRDEDGNLFGNYAENGRDVTLRGRVDLVKLYNKIRYLRFANTPNPPKERFTRPVGTSNPNVAEGNQVLKSLTRLLMTVRGINFNYTNTRGTLLPGFLPQPQFFGLSESFNPADALPFVLGNQRTGTDPTQGNGWLAVANRNGWLSSSQIRNDPFIQSRQRKFDYNITLEPFKGFRMQINGRIARGDDYQVLYRPDSTGFMGAQNAVRNGNMAMSFWSFNTLPNRMQKVFTPKVWQQDDIFDLFRNYRPFVIDYLNQRLGADAANRFNANSQDVLLTAFLAAYSGKGLYKTTDLERYAALKSYLDKTIEVSNTPDGARATFTNLFRNKRRLQLPFPNWRVDYGGIEKYGSLSRIFNSITLSHSYVSNYNVGNFTSSLTYGNSASPLQTVSDLVYLNLLANRYTYGFRTGDLVNSALFSPIFVMSTVTMEEKFGPLIGLNFSMKNGFTGRLDWNLEHRSGLNLTNQQVANFSRNDFVFSMGVRKKDVRLPVRGRDGNAIRLKNDLNASLNVTVSDMKAIQRPMVGEPIAIQGNYNVQIRPQVQYEFNRKFSASFYVERLVNNPFTSLSFVRRHTIGGVNVRFNLSD